MADVAATYEVPILSVWSPSMKSVLLACLSVLTLTTTALAFSPELVNEDSSSYDYELECGGSTTNSSIDGNSSTSLSSGCTLRVRGAGSASLREDMRCTISGGSLSCR
jgi:hypothetical protein